MQDNCDSCPLHYRCTLENTALCTGPVLEGFSPDDERKLREHLTAWFNRLYTERLPQTRGVA